MIYDQYHRLCKFRRGLKRLSNDSKQFTAHQRFQFLNEIKSLDARISALEKVLSIEVVGDWEFSNLAVNYSFYPPEQEKQHRIEKALRSKWHYILNSKARHQHTKEYMKEYHRKRRERIRENSVALEKERKWRREYMKKRYQDKKK